ncbi:MAG: hypothetical protein KDE31_19560 [Caldilineaceae bacterium]|nr:hypothetical protein [Caldilineaceae bacterium]
MNRFLSPYTIAQAIRALDSRLLAIELEETNGHCRLVYRYAVAGTVENFYTLLTGDSVHSIAALYPQAEPFEEQLCLRYGIHFHS